MPQQSSLPYGEEVSLGELAVETIIVGLKTRYDSRALKDPLKAERIPSDEKLEKLARYVKERSVRNGRDDHLGTAKRFT